MHIFNFEHEHIFIFTKKKLHVSSCLGFLTRRDEIVGMHVLRNLFVKGAPCFRCSWMESVFNLSQICTHNESKATRVCAESDQLIIIQTEIKFFCRFLDSDKRQQHESDDLGDSVSHDESLEHGNARRRNQTWHQGTAQGDKTFT